MNQSPPQPPLPVSLTLSFFKLPEDIVLNIFFKLEDDPRHWARLACVCTKFSALIRTVCFKSRCLSFLPSVSADLSSPSFSSPPGGWTALHKIAVCCPGLRHSGVLLEHSDFGLELDLGPDHHFISTSISNPITNDTAGTVSTTAASVADPGTGTSDCWSLYDDLYFDTVYDKSESPENHETENSSLQDGEREEEEDKVKSNSLPSMSGDSHRHSSSTCSGSDIGCFSVKRRKLYRPLRSHLASGGWNLSREQGNKLLASRFRGDTLYICDWPGCVHLEEKRSYMLFRGIFKDFKKSRVWRTINDCQKGKIGLNCAFCGCMDTWDLHSAFCLRRVFGYHDDGEPVVRAFVCENGHVSGAWTDWPLYN